VRPGQPQCATRKRLPIIPGFTPCTFSARVELAVTPETGWDLLSLGIGIAELSAGGPSALVIAGILFDAAAVIAPGLPGGLSVHLRLLRQAEALKDAIAAGRNFFP